MELIDKEALLKAIGRDSDGIMGQYGDEWLFVKTIESMPIIQLVNCKDCLYASHLAGNLWTCPLRRDSVNENGYCHIGELEGEE